MAVKTVQKTMLWLMLSAAVLAGPLKKWELCSPCPANYAANTDQTAFHLGKASGHLRSLPAPPPSAARHYAVLSQSIRADHYLQRRIRLTGYIRTRDVQGWAGMWLRVDPLRGPALEFDNMEKRPIRGTTPWTLYEITVEVPRDAHTLHFGVLLQGSGEVWLDDVGLTSIGEALPASKARRKVRSDLPLEPLNPGFED